MFGPFLRRLSHLLLRRLGTWAFWLKSLTFRGNNIIVGKVVLRIGLIDLALQLFHPFHRTCVLKKIERETVIHATIGLLHVINDTPE